MQQQTAKNPVFGTAQGFCPADLFGYRLGVQGLMDGRE